MQPCLVEMNYTRITESCAKVGDVSRPIGDSAKRRGIECDMGGDDDDDDRARLSRSATR